jgi:hypothetical protein
MSDAFMRYTDKHPYQAWILYIGMWAAGTAAVLLVGALALRLAVGMVGKEFTMMFVAVLLGLSVWHWLRDSVIPLL